MPRKLTILLAEKPLSKSFNKDGTSTPYPMMKNFTSSEFNYYIIQELYEGLKVAAESNACMLKGHLTKTITNEPRAGLTNPSEPTDLLVIDYDSDTGFNSIEEMLGEIDPLLTSTDYIFQHSASSGITGKSGLRGHVFVMLTTPKSPQLLKQWLKKINLLSDKFRARIKLSRNATALCYALDITVNQNDKLIYIAPPILEAGMVDPVKTRWELHIGARRTYDLTASASLELNRAKEDELINELQTAACLPRRKPRYKSVGETEVLVNPAQCFLTDTKDCGAFVRLNINGGDSFAYWHYKENPDILYNFKGEPPVYIRDILPGYHAQLLANTTSSTIKPFVFRNVPTNTFYNIEYDDDSGYLINCYKASRSTLNDFMLQRGCPAPRVVPDWTMIYDPTQLNALDFKNKILNTYKPSPYMRTFARANANRTPTDFPAIHKILTSICVDEATYEHFVNWLAHIVQFRTKTQSAWIFSGTEGTGKGLMFTHILKPLLGEESCFMITQKQNEDRFNDYLRGNMLLFLDEGDIDSSKQADQILASFRSIITEPALPIRAMHTDTVLTPNYTNLIIATNKPLPVRITSGDRRYNVAPRQYTRLQIEFEEVEGIAHELQAFSEYLRDREVTTTQAHKLLENQAREDLLVLSRTVADEFFIALREHQMEFFTERLQETVPIPENGYLAYSKTITGWMRKVGEPMEVTIDDLVNVYRYISGNDDMTPKRFGHLAGRHNFTTRQKRVNGIQRRIYDIQFDYRDYNDWFNRPTNKTNNVTVLKTGGA